jgi:penicillin-binding protein 1A
MNFKFDHVKKGKRQPDQPLSHFFMLQRSICWTTHPVKFAAMEYTYLLVNTVTCATGLLKILVAVGKHENLEGCTGKLSKYRFCQINGCRDRKAVLDRVKQWVLTPATWVPTSACFRNWRCKSLWNGGCLWIFANGGIYNEPVLVTSIEDKMGTVSTFRL